MTITAIRPSVSFESSIEDVNWSMKMVQMTPQKRTLLFSPSSEWDSCHQREHADSKLCCNKILQFLNQEYWVMQVLQPVLSNGCKMLLVVLVVAVGFITNNEWLIAGRLYALQKGMEIDRKSPDCRSFLSALMNMLEEVTVQSCNCCWWQFVCIIIVTNFEKNCFIVVFYCLPKCCVYVCFCFCVGTGKLLWDWTLQKLLKSLSDVIWGEQTHVDPRNHY